MSDIYKIKVYHNNTLNISTATYFADTYVSLNGYNSAAGALVDSNMNLTALGQTFQDNDGFKMCKPFLYNSGIDNSVLFTRALSFFDYSQAMAIDVHGILTSSRPYKWLFFTTDNATSYVAGQFYIDNNGRVNPSGLQELYKKTDNSHLSSNFGNMSVVNGTSGNVATDFRLAFGSNTLSIYVDINVSYGNIIKVENGSTCNIWNLLLENDEPYVPVTDPYDGAGDSTTGGGDGTFDGSSDPVPVPSLPSIGATDTGFISLFVPSASQIRQVATYLWGPLLDISTFKKLFEDPMDCILGLSVVPVAVPTSGNAQITVGNVELSGITLPLASQQYVELDCGTITFDRYFGSYLDFEPYTKMSLFVPYSGVHSVSADDIMGKTVGLKYHIDILTGSLVAFLTCGDSVLYEFNGACASNIPVNSMNYASTIENAIRIAVNIGTTVATAGAAAPATGAVEAGKVAAGGAGIGRGIAIAGSTAEGALSLKPSIDRAGSLGGTTGLMGNQIPYFIITRPRMCKPKNQDFFQGYPSFIQTVLGDMEGTGFTAFENVILAETYLTETEKAELSSILSAGVYL